MAQKEYSFGDNVKWIDISEPSQEDFDSIHKSYGFNQHLVQDSMDPDHLPKYDQIKDVQFIIVRMYNHSIEKQISTIQELSNKIALFFTDQYIITLHRQSLHFMELIKTKYIDSDLIHTTYEVVEKIVWYALESFNDPALRLSEKVDFFESQIFLKGITKEQLEPLYYIKRQASISHKLLVLTLEPINHLSINAQNEASIQDIKDHHLKMTTMFSQIIDETNNLLNLYISFAAQRTNEVMRVLTIFSVFFMPITFLAGIYGMNFKYMPELNKSWGYPVTLFLMSVVTLIIFLWFKRKKWL